MKAKVVKVNILGQDYVVRSVAGQKYLETVAQYVDNKMEEIKASGIDDSQQLRIAILAAMLSTVLAVVDSYPRLLTESYKIVKNKADSSKDRRFMHSSLMFFYSIIATLIIISIPTIDLLGGGVGKLFTVSVLSSISTNFSLSSSKK